MNRKCNSSMSVSTLYLVSSSVALKSVSDDGPDNVHDGPDDVPIDEPDDGPDDTHGALK